tara:strand:- start:96 stop:662 length:567 start_codon:yes stop_codon:yes gene_type:complete
MLDQVSKNQELDFVEINKNSIEDSVLKLNANVNSIVQSEARVEDENENVVAEVAEILKNLQELEELGCNVHTAFDKLYDLNGWAYKMQDADEGKQITIDGDPAPKKISTYKSEAKRAYTHNKRYKLKGFQTWQELKSSYKKPDQFLALSSAVKELKAKLNAVKSEKADWIVDATKEIEKITAKYAKLS